jgi:integrase
MQHFARHSPCPERRLARQAPHHGDNCAKTSHWAGWPGQRSGFFFAVTKPISDNTFNKALRTMGYDTKTQHCAHGFRTTASTLLNGERRSDGDLAWHPDVIELCLAHTDDDEVRAIYNRARLWPERCASDAALGRSTR